MATSGTETVAEQKFAAKGEGAQSAGIENASASQGAAGDSQEKGADSENDGQSTKKAKPPPLDVTAAQEYNQSTMSGPKTPTSAPPVTPGQALDRRKARERKIGHRRVDEEGQITFKKIQTTQIMGSIQLGISYAVGRLASKPERDLLMQDFTIVETTSFPHEGSNLTPAHHYSDFKFKAYAPVAFRYFRDLFGIQPEDFLLSLCTNPMRELTNPGASGSIFYLTEDDEFIIKTVQHKEAEFLQKLLPGYYMNLNQNPRTLLPKFFGLYCYQCGGKNVRLVVMNNLLPSSIRLHEKYDLKGSTYKRKASKHERKKQSPTYKDLDFMERHTDGILLEHETYTALVKTIQRDCRVLESFKIMDYSLLVGIHNVDLAKREKVEQRMKQEDMDGNGRLSGESGSGSPVQPGAQKSDTNLVRSKSINRQRLAAFSTAMESIQAEVEAADQDDDVPPGGIPAKNTKGEHLLLFLGIIDILQSFRLKKKLEHTWKSVLHDGDTVSVHRPGFYAQRFQDFMGKTVFKKLPSSGQHRKFRTMVTSVLALKHSPSKRKGVSVRQRPPSTGESDLPRSLLPKIPSEAENSQEEGTSVDASAPATVPSPHSPPVGGSTSVSGEIKQQQPWSPPEGLQKSRANTDPVPQKTFATRTTTVVSKTASVSWDKTDVASLSQVTIQTESVGSGMSETSSSSTSGLGSTLHTVTWTPPHSVEGSTPTHTEGTPSFTESSSSGDAACPTTPVKSITKSFDSLPPLGETHVVQGTEMHFSTVATSMKIIPEEGPM